MTLLNIIFYYFTYDCAPVTLQLKATWLDNAQHYRSRDGPMTLRCQ